MNREIRRKERAEREVKQLRGDLEEKNKEIEELKAAKSSIQITVERLEHSLNEQRTTNDGLVKQLVSFAINVIFFNYWLLFGQLGTISEDFYIL